MQNQKARNGPSEVSQKKSEVTQKTYARALSSEASQKVSPKAGASTEVSQKISPKVVRQLKTSGLESESSSTSSSQSIRTPKNNSPKVGERKSPRSPISEKKRTSRVSELESQVTQLQNDLTTVKNQLILSESSKKQAILEKDESLNSPDLESAKNEIKKLNTQIQIISDSEAEQAKQALSANTELKSLKENMAETLSHIEEIKNELKECKESESKAKALVGETLFQLETAKHTVEILRLDDVKAKDAFDDLVSELEQTKVKVNSLEKIVTKLKIEHGATESKYHEEQIRSTVEVTTLYQVLEDLKTKLKSQEEEFESEIVKAKTGIEELKANLMDKETELQGICEENEELNSKLDFTHSAQREFELEKELKKVKDEIDNLKANMMDKENELQNITEENEILKTKVNSDTLISELDELKALEKEALAKLGNAMEEKDKNFRRATRVAEQLEAAQAVNSEMEAELRRLKVQSDQWRKAAEAAAAMLSTGNNGKLVDRTCSLDSNYSPATGNKISSPFSEEMDDDFLKKKNGNVLKRIGILWKKPQK